MLNCETASQLASRAMDEKLSFRQNMALNLHLLLCRSCSNFTQQLNFLRQVSRHSGKLIEFKLADEAKRRISKVLKDKQAS